MSSEVYPSLPGLTFGTERTYAFVTDVQENVSGAEVRQAKRAYPVRSWMLKYEFLRQNLARTEFVTLVSFFFRHRGRFDDFLFEDPADNAATDQLLGSGDGVRTQFQLLRRWQNFAEPIYSPKAISEVRVNGTPTAGYTVNASTGIITFSSPPASGHAVRVDFTYYWRVRFEDDKLTLVEFVKLFFETRRLGLRFVPP